MQFIYPRWTAPANVHALTTTRMGGVSEAPYASFNLGTQVGDPLEQVRKNRERLQNALSLPSPPFWLNQEHGARVVRAPEDANTLTADGSITDKPNVVCAVLTADCLPLLLCNHQGTEVAAIHCSWRSLAAGIIHHAVCLFLTQPQSLIAWLGPCIGPKIYEVGEDVYRTFVDQSSRDALGFTPCGHRKWLADLPQLATIHLKTLGIVNIFSEDYCTHQQADWFYSHRRDGITGRMATLIWFNDL